MVDSDQLAGYGGKIAIRPFTSGAFLLVIV